MAAWVGLVTHGMTQVGDVVFDWGRTKAGDHAAGYRVVTHVIRCEHLGRFTDGIWRRGSTTERCALHGGSTRPQQFDVRD